VCLVRAGRQWSVHAHAYRWLRPRLGSFDLVVDQVNTLPFCTPLYVPEHQRRLFIWQLAKEYWWRETRGVFRLGAPAGYMAEPWLLKLYRSTDTITLSDSSREDLVGLGIPPRRISVIPPAITITPLERLAPKEGPPRVVMAGRLTPAKFVEEGFQAFAVMAREVPNAQLDVVGTGEPSYRRKLEQLAERLSISARVTFHGRVDNATLAEIFMRAHIHLFSSHREGWGLVVSEAAAMGTPSVGYDAPGVRDSIADPQLLARPFSVQDLAERMRHILSDHNGYERIRLHAWDRSRQLSFDASADAFLEAVSASSPEAMRLTSRQRL
jgi:glycosyltransferase involved in cell wall biosynthesis